MEVSLVCKECGLECKNIKSLTLHFNQKHNMDSKIYYDKYYKTDTDGICPVCGNPTNFFRISQGGYMKYCSKKCSANANETKQKKLETNIEKYGGIGFASKELYDKTKNTCLEKYGVGYASQSNDFKNELKQNMLKKYGVLSVNQCDWKINKTKETCLEKYGVESNMQTSEFKEKSKETCLEKYGTEIGSQSDIVKQKMIETNQQKYGVDWPMQNKEIAYANFMNRYAITLNTYKIKYNNIIDYKDHIFTIKCNDCNKLYNISYSLFYQRISNNMNPCLNCNPLNKQFSNAEKQVYDYIKSIYDGNIIENDRSVLSGKELDIYIPEKRLAFEYDGLYWHNELNKPNNYHVEKSNTCEKLGVQLIHIFEDEWLYKQDIVKSRIKGLLGLNERIFARKCVLKEVSYKDSEEFLNRCHIQGNCISKYRYGLYYEDRLVSLMTFGESRFKSGEFELLRFCNELNLNVVGGASKLFKHFLVDHPEINKVISFADRRWSIGNLYPKLGFKNIDITTPAYFYVIDDMRHNRIEFQKHKLIKEGFDPNLSEHEIMLQREIYRIYDCGNIKFEYTREA